MAEYKSFIDTIYNTINDKTKSDVDKSNTIIDGIIKIMGTKTNNKPESPDLTKVSCSSFSNTVVQFVCKLDKNKDKICNIPGPVAWVIGKDKINAIINFITINPSFVDTVWQRFQNDSDKNQLNNLLKNTQIKTSSQSCINNIQTFLKNLQEKANSVSRPSSIASTASLTTIESSNMSSRPSSFASTTTESSDMSSRPSSISSMPSSNNSVSSDNSNKRYGIRLSSSSTPIATPTPINRDLTPEERNPVNMYTTNTNLTDFEKNPANMYLGGRNKTKRRNKRNKTNKGRNKKNKTNKGKNKKK